MPIRVLCPSCGRSGRVPEQAIGRTVQCPACGARRRLTAADVIPDDGDRVGAAPSSTSLEGLEILDDGPPPLPREPGGRNLAGQEGRPRVQGLRTPDTGKARPAPTSAAPEGRAPFPMTVAITIGVSTFAATSLVVGLLFWAFSPRHDAKAPGVEVVAAKVAVDPVGEDAPAPVIPKDEETSIAARGLAVKEEPAPPDPPDAASPPAAPVDAPAERDAVASVAPAPIPPPGLPLSTAEIVARYEPSIALIKGKGSSGTGFLVGPNLLATNSHVIDDDFIKNLEVRFPSADPKRRGPLAVELVYEDPKRDLAFLAVKTTLPPVAIAESYLYRKGEDVTVIGNPGVDGETVLENAISRGVMSTKAELEGQKYYQLGIAVNPGNSGGPVFDSTGRVIGVVTLRIPGKEELSFCIPVEELRDAMARLRTQSSKDLDLFRSQHRLKHAFKALCGGGAVYGVALEVHLVARSNAQDQELGEKARKLDEVLAEMEKSGLLGLDTEVRGARNDLLVPPQTRRKIGDLADNYKKLREAFERSRNSVPLDAIRALKTSHRQLVAELGPLLKVELPAGLLALLDDHITTTGTAVATVIPMSPADALRARVWERHGITPPGTRGLPGRTIPGRSNLNRPRGRFGR